MADGLVSFSDIKSHIAREAEELAVTPSYLTRRMPGLTLRRARFRELAQHLETHTKRGVFGPTVLVATNNMFFGMARMFAILSELDDGPPFRICRQVDDALKWLEASAGSRPLPAVRVN